MKLFPIECIGVINCNLSGPYPDHMCEAIDTTLRLRHDVRMCTNSVHRTEINVEIQRPM